VEIASPSCLNESELHVGAVVIATGAREYRDARLHRHDGRRVVPLSEFQLPTANLHAERPTSIVYLLCAGSRDDQIPYCSHVCCLGALNQAIRVKHANPTANVTILFRDLYLLGDDLNQEVVREARRLGVEFVHYAVSKPPRVEDDFVVACDAAGNTRRIGYDRVVLATPLVPREDAGQIAKLFKLPRDDDGFFPDPHWRLRPEQQSERGIFVCGSAHRPVDIDTAILQGLTAAARAARFIQKRQLMRPALSAWVNAKLCTGCAQCVETCAFGAITLTPAPLSLQWRGDRGEGLSRAAIDPFLCQACGNCLAACPSKAIDMPAASDAQIFAQIQAAFGRHGDGETGRPGDALHLPTSPHHRILVFACHWSGQAAMELAGARRLKYPESVRVIELPCSARLDPVHVLYAFFNGAEAVMLALCPPNECHFGQGNRYAEARVENLRAQLATRGIDPRRLTVARMMGDDAAAWVKGVKEVASRAPVSEKHTAEDRQVL
jgi:heterodisulfide reductase subunit A